LRFVRVRSPAVLRRVLQMDGAHHLTGFVFPKATRRNLDEYLTALSPADPFRVMLILETADVFDSAEMSALRARLLEDSCRHRILSLRIGGNDLLQFLGLRRPRRRSIYATPLGPLIHQLIATFRPVGFNLTGPVFEWLDRDKLLASETRRDVAAGLFGKSAIHPDQIPIIESAYQVNMRDLHTAEKILAANAASVFRFDGAMCEPATHRTWATLTLERARIFGVRDTSSQPRIVLHLRS
jgi:citrate lyase beta subunit